MIKQDEKIEVYKDKILLEMIGQMANLTTEETGFLLSEEKVNENGRTMKNVASDMINIYERTNNHLANKYPNNKVAESWIAVNEFSLNLMKERWL